MALARESRAPRDPPPRAVWAPRRTGLRSSAAAPPARFNPPVEPEIVPEPTPEDREAILAALAEDEQAGGDGAAWRRAALEGEEDD